MNYYTDIFSPETYEAFSGSDRRITGFSEAFQYRGTNRAWG